MKAKLTLTIEEAILREAKKYSRIHNKSLSNLIEDYLKKLSTRKKSVSIVDATRGILKKSYAGKTYDQIKEEMYNQKHGL